VTTHNDYVSFPCLRIDQPIGGFYVGVVDALDLVDICWTDVQRIEGRNLDTFLGIERPLSQQRVKELQEYVQTIDATFPTGILVAVSSDDAEYDESTRTMRIVRKNNVAKIIDGQHRIEGLKSFGGPVFQVNLTVFVDMDLEDQAMVFATINLKQTTVSKSLAYNLYEYATKRSPQKTAHEIAKLLNSRKDSPFSGKIKILGTATPGREGETLTQAAFVESLLPLISDDPDSDREMLKGGRKKPERAGSAANRLIFRDMFLDEREEAIAKVLWNYFSAVRRKWASAWITAERGMVLNRTTGLAALMRLLPFAYLATGQAGKIPNEDVFFAILRKSRLGDSDFTSEKYVPGSTGQRNLFDDLREGTGLNDLVL